MHLSGRGVALSVGASLLFAVLPGYVQLLAPLDGIQFFAQRVRCCARPSPACAASRCCWPPGRWRRC
jgi:hypothetical protein